MSVLFVVILIAVASYLLGFPVAKILTRLGAVDQPNARSSHLKPVVRGGGIAMAGGAFLLVFCGFPLPWGVTAVMLSAALGIGVVSFYDDIKSVGAAIRFGCHSVAAIAALVVLHFSSLGLDSSGFPVPVMALLWLLGFLWIVGYTNAFNFMDGINGLAAGQAIVTGFGMALLGALASGPLSVVRCQSSVISPPMLWCVAIASAALGFLPHNFPRARMFMGDVGSAPLGFCLAMLTLWLAKSVGWWLLIPLVLLHANFVLDTGITLVRRIFRGERLYDAHREHFYQRLIRSGRSHPFVTGLEMALQGVVLGLMVLYLHASLPMRAGLIALVMLIWLAFFGYCERSFRRKTEMLTN